MTLISVVVPCYNEEKSLPLFLSALADVARTMRDEYAADVEAILVDDGSSDGTLALMKHASAGGAGSPYAPLRIRWISFSRNFGKEAGILAGLEHARGDYVALMDADMQDRQAYFPRCMTSCSKKATTMWRHAASTATANHRSARFFARMFYKLINHISKADIVDGARDFRLMKRSMVDAILSMREYNRFSKGIFGWVGFKTKWLPYVNVERVAGETKWSFFSLLLYSIDGIVAFSTVPLSIASVAGILLCLAAFIGIIVIVVKTLAFGDPVDGWPSLACLITGLGGIQLLCLGIMGQYLAKTYLETKRRPLYIIRESSDDSNC